MTDLTFFRINFKFTHMHKKQTLNTGQLRNTHILDNKVSIVFLVIKNLSLRECFHLKNQNSFPFEFYFVLINYSLEVCARLLGPWQFYNVYQFRVSATYYTHCTEELWSAQI